MPIISASEACRLRGILPADCERTLDEEALVTRRTTPLCNLIFDTPEMRQECVSTCAAQPSMDFADACLNSLVAREEARQKDAAHQSNLTIALSVIALLAIAATWAFLRASRAAKTH